MSGFLAATVTAVGGGGAAKATLTNGTYTAEDTGTASAALRIGNDGLVYSGMNGTFSSEYAWTGEPAGNFEVRADVNSGSSPTGASLATWLNAGTTRTWTLSNAVVGTTKYSNLAVQVRIAANGAVIASCTVELYAERT